MGYFSNGAEGRCYEAEYCARCVHGIAPTGQRQELYICPVMLLHEQWNSEQNGRTEIGKAKREALDALIPQAPTHTHNEQCALFHALTEEDVREAREARQQAERERRYFAEKGLKVAA
jgi:hypothetical protein